MDMYNTDRMIMPINHITPKTNRAEDAKVLSRAINRMFCSKGEGLTNLSPEEYDKIRKEDREMLERYGMFNILRMFQEMIWHMEEAGQELERDYYNPHTELWDSLLSGEEMLENIS